MASAAASGGADGGDRYVLLPSAFSLERIFSTTRQTQHGLRFLAMMLAAGILPALAVLFWADHYGPAGLHPGRVFALALAAGLIVAVWALNVVPTWGFRELERDLCTRLERNGIAVREWGGTFMGLALGEHPRVYEGNYSWDIGFLFRGEGRGR